MKKILAGMILLIAGTPDLYGFYLTSQQTKPLLISREVADSISLFKGKGAFEVPGSTEDNLNHLQEFLIRRYQIHQDAKKDASLLKSGLDQNPKEAWIKYSTETMNEPQLVALTKTVVSIFPNSQSLPGEIVESWNSIIEKQNYDAGTVLGLFNEPGEKIKGSLGQKIYDACARQRALPTVKDLRKSLIGGKLDPTLQSVVPESLIDLNSDKEENNIEDKKTSWFGLTAIKSVISQRWSQMGYLKKWVVGGGLPILAVVCLYLQYRR